MTLSLPNYFLLGFSVDVDGWYFHSFEIWLTCVAVFPLRRRNHLHGFHGERELGSMPDVFDGGRTTSADSELRTYGPVRWRDRTGVLSLTVIVNTFPDILASVPQQRFSSSTGEYFPPFKSTLAPSNLPWAPVLPRYIHTLAFVIGEYLIGQETDSPSFKFSVAGFGLFQRRRV